MTPTALYERKRALIKLGMLPSPQGRGRRSGALASPDTVALLIVARLATDNLSETDDRVQRLASAPLTGTYRGTSSKSVGDRCLWTHAQTFVEAVAYMLSSRAPIRHTGIRIDRSDMSASITFVWKGRGRSEFGHPDRTDNPIEVKAALRFEALRSIHQILNIKTTEAAP